MSGAVLAVDGGHSGAAVLMALDPEHPPEAPTWAVDLLAVFGWRVRGTTAPEYRLSWLLGGPRPAFGRLAGLHTPYRIGSAVRAVLRANGRHHHRLVVEDAFLGRNPRTMITGVRWAAQFSAALEDATLGGVPELGGATEWMMPDDWRAGALGIRRGTKREDAKRLTAAALPAGLKAGVAPVAAELGDPEHLHDALGIGLWALGVRVAYPPPSKRKRKATAPG